jgi:hypothetical protein
MASWINSALYAFGLGQVRPIHCSSRSLVDARARV